MQRYAHFTSPIRRYADLIVHRALIRALKLGEGGLTDSEIARLGETAEHISMTERRAMAAERNSTDRYVAAFMEDRVGATFEARITGVTRFGLFVRLKETGADGLLPDARAGHGIFPPRRTRTRWSATRSGTLYQPGRYRSRCGWWRQRRSTGGLRFELAEAHGMRANATRHRRR